jgi:hypothetical protein
MPKQEKHADPESLLGQLQRGRGEGYLRSLAVRRREAWDHLVDCISNDPRLDSQIEDRAQYYASSAIETELELEPLLQYARRYDQDDQGWNTPLAIGTLGELAKRNYKNAAKWLSDYVAWGQWWDWTLDGLCSIQDPVLHQEIGQKVERRFPLDCELEEALAWFDLDTEQWATLARNSGRIARLAKRPRKTAGRAPDPPFPSNLASLGTKHLLQIAGERNRHKLRKMIKQVVKPSDLDLLKESVSLEKPFVTDVALAGIAQLASPSILPWAMSLWSANPDMPGFLRTRIGEVLLSLPPKLTLPLARERLYHREWHERHLAEEVFEAHATPEDIPILRHAIHDALADDEENCYRLCSLIQAFSNLPDCGPIPELNNVFLQFRYSYGRARTAEALHVTAPALFCEKFAHECLWDCESRTHPWRTNSSCQSQRDHGSPSLPGF